MKVRLLLGLILALTLTSGARSQSTAVSATITDSGGQAWINGSYTFTTAALGQTPITGTLDSSGAFTSITFPHNSFTAAVGDIWTAKICPDATSGCFVKAVTISGATQSLSSTLIPAAISLSIPFYPAAISTIRAYADAEITATPKGGAYYSTTTNAMRVCTTVSGTACTVWVASGGGGGASYGTGGGTAQAQTVTPTPAVSALTVGLNVCWLPAANNTAAAPTLAVAGLTAKPITKYGTVALVANDITTVGVACAIYDGTEFQLQVPLAGGVFTSSISTGTGASAVGATAQGGFACAESTSTGWTPTAGQDYERCDSTNHNFTISVNGAAETPAPVFSAAPAGSKCLQSSGTNGLIVEAAVACSGAATLNAIGNPTASSSFQPTVDASVLFKQFSGTNAVDIFHIQDKSANELFRADSAGTLRFWNGSCSISNSSLFCGGGTSVGASTYITATNCANGASPAVCASAAAGAVAVPTGTNPTLVINTTAVTANSRIFLGIDESLTISATTCNTTLSTLVQPVVTARTAGTSFTIQIGAVIATNPACVSYFIVN